MFLTENEENNLRLYAEGMLNESDVLKALLLDDEFCEKKQKMAEGERYYAGEHDILKKSFNESVISETIEQNDTCYEREKLFKNPNRSNHHVVNAFHRLLVDQKTAYILGKRPTIYVSGAQSSDERKKYEKFLSSFVGEYFCDVLQSLIIGASNKGLEVLQVYYDELGELGYSIVPANELILIYDEKNGQRLREVIRYYAISVLENGEKKIRRKAEWWTNEGVSFYEETKSGDFIRTNEQPHFWREKYINGECFERTKESFGRLPFIVLRNNSRCTTDLESIKGLIDAYDLLSSEGVNNLLDLVELYWVIEGYGGEAAGAIAQKLKINKAVHISDSGGRVEAKQVSLPVDARLSFMNNLKNDIFTFGQGVDVQSDKFGAAPSGVALKFKYTLLDLKAGAMITKIVAAIRELLYFATLDYNNKTSSEADASWIEVIINKTMVTNDSETAEIIERSKELLSRKTLLAKHPFVDDVTLELEEIKDQEHKDETNIENKIEKNEEITQ